MQTVGHEEAKAPFENGQRARHARLGKAHGQDS